MSTALDRILHFFKTGKIDVAENFFYSQTRGEFLPRLIRISDFLKTQKADENTISLIVACAGEIGNNAFDHNLGHWQDLPGLVIGWSLQNNLFSIGFADRGRGIITSLKEVIKEPATSQQVMNMAFEKIISGRQPEKRGNGLKFVCQAIKSTPNQSLLCFSNKSFYRMNSCSAPVPELSNLKQDFGTLIFLQWRIKS